MAYKAATLNPEILKKILGPVRVGKKKSGSGRVAGTRQGLVQTTAVHNQNMGIFHRIVCLILTKKEIMNKVGSTNRT